MSNTILPDGIPPHLPRNYESDMNNAAQFVATELPETITADFLVDQLANILLITHPTLTTLAQASSVSERKLTRHQELISMMEHPYLVRKLERVPDLDDYFVPLSLDRLRETKGDLDILAALRPYQKNESVGEDVGKEAIIHEWLRLYMNSTHTIVLALLEAEISGDPNREEKIARLRGCKVSRSSARPMQDGEEDLGLTAKGDERGKTRSNVEVKPPKTAASAEGVVVAVENGVRIVKSESGATAFPLTREGFPPCPDLGAIAESNAFQFMLQVSCGFSARRRNHLTK